MSYVKRTVVDVDVADVQKRKKPTKTYVYVLNVKWSEGTKFSIYRNYSMLIEFQAKLSDQFPGKIPALPGRFVFGRGAVLAEKRKTGIADFCKHLIKLPLDVVQSDEFLAFFEAWPEDVTVQFDFESNLQGNAFYVSAEAGSKAPGAANEALVGDKTDEVELYRAVATWKARSPREISFACGDRVEVIEKNMNGWWVVCCGNREGVAPASYIEPLHHRPEDDRAEEDPYKGVYIVSIDFRGRNHDELTLEGNTVVDILQTNLDGWWFIRADGKEGLFPSTFLKKMSVHKGGRGHSRTSVVEEEATYGVLVNPPPRRREIEEVDSIYSSIASLKRDPPAAQHSTKSSSMYQYIEHGSFASAHGGADDSGSDSGSDIFAYADFAPAGSDDPAPEYSEIGSPADAAKQRKKIKESMASIREGESNSRSAQKPEHKPQRLGRSVVSKQKGPRVTQSEILAVFPEAAEQRRTDFSEGRTISNESTTSTSAVQREDDIDLYKIISAYSSTESDLSLQLGDIVEVDDIEDGWAYVRLLRRDKQQISPADAQEGWAPAAYVQRCPKRKPKPRGPAPTLPGDGPPQQNAPQLSDSGSKKPQRSDSGPIRVHQQPTPHQKVRPTQSLNDDVIPITMNLAQPTVYVNTQPYVNIENEDGRGGDNVYASASSPGPNMDSRRRHVSPPSSHSFGRHMSGGIGDGGTSGSSGHRRSSSPSHAYVNTISSSASDTSTSYVNVDLTGSSLCDPLDGDFQSIYVALCDYRTMAPGCLSFSEGDKAQLMQVKGQGWWKVKMNNDNGWVPASYFEKELMPPNPPPPSHTTTAPTSLPARGSSMSTGSLGRSTQGKLATVRSAQPAPPSSATATRRQAERSSFLDLPAGSTGRTSPGGRSPSPIRRSPSSSSVNPQVLQQIQKNISNQAWFHGKVSRKDAEDLMTRDGKDGDFIIRESANRVGDFALTVVYNARVRHFPIEVTMEGKVLIGKHRFESLNKIIQHYKECPLFIQDGAHISLGQPFKKKK